MTEQTSSQSLSPSRWQVQRPLSEPVLESAEQELGSPGASSTPSRPEQRSAVSGNGIDHKGWQAWNQMREQLSQRVSEQPGRTALLAVGAGALAGLWLSCSLSHGPLERFTAPAYGTPMRRAGSAMRPWALSRAGASRWISWWR